MVMSKYILEKANERLHTNAAIALLFHLGRRWRGVGEPGRYTDKVCSPRNTRNTTNRMSMQHHEPSSGSQQSVLSCISCVWWAAPLFSDCWHHRGLLYESYNQRVDRTAAPPCSFGACRENLGAYCCRVAGLPAAVGHSYRCAYLR
jgi:hypothetical protein